MKKNVSYYLLLSGQILFMLLFSILFLQIIFFMKSDNSIFNSVSFVKMTIYALGLAIFILCYSLHHKMQKYLLNNFKIFMIVACILWLMLQLTYIYTTYSKTDSDAYVVNHLAWNLTHNIESEEFYWQYFARYQNNLPLLALCSGFYKLTGSLLTYENSWIVLAFISGICADIAIYWTVKLSTALSSHKEESCLFSFIAATLLIGLSEEGTIFYTDIVTLWTIPCSLYYLYLAFELNKKVFKNAVLSGIILGVGGIFKPQIFVIPVAVFIVKGLLYFLHRECSKSTTKNFFSFYLAMFATYLLLSGTCITWYISVLPVQFDGKTYLDEQKFPGLHWINMGLNKSTYGAYSLEDVTFTGNISGSQEKKEALFKSIQQRLESMPLPDLLIYENKKVVLAMQNGTFSQGMVWKGALINHSAYAQKLQPYFVSIYSQWKNGIGLFAQIIYIFSLLLCLYLIFRYLKSKSWIFEPLVQIMSVSLTGAVCFIVLLEQNMRYFYTFLPVLVALSSKGMELIIYNNIDLPMKT